MRYVALMCLLLCSASAQAATRNVTVLVNFEGPHSPASMPALRQELEELLAPAGITVDLMLKSEMPLAPQFSDLVIFEMKGSCSMNAPLPVGMANQSDQHPLLGMAYTSDGQVLHFGEVECDHVRRCLQRITGVSRPEKHQAAYGAALGIVVAHEIYHMILGAKKHTKVGLTKESLSAHELLGGELAIPEVVREAMRRDIGLLP